MTDAKGLGGMKFHCLYGEDGLEPAERVAGVYGWDIIALVLV